MIYKVLEKLKTGAVTNVYLYGHNASPAAPYVVVKEEAVPGRGTHIRVFAFFQAGQQKFLRTYVRKTLLTLLDQYEAVSADGNRNIVLSEDQISDILPEDDGTISMSRLFLIPDLF